MIYKKNCKKRLKFLLVLTYISVTTLNAMKNIRKFNSVASAVITVILIAWIATLALRGYCSWGINGFAGYSLIVYVFMSVVHGFADHALSVKSDNFVENLEEI